MVNDPREIKNSLKSYKIHAEKEKPSRWTFMKVLRENSNLKEFYPEINPYAEAYKWNDTTYCILYEGVGCADTWNYLINGPEKAMLIDTSFGLGDLPGLVKKLVGDKELIVVNTHSHLDHILGNSHFKKIYCHEYDKKQIEKDQTPEFFKNCTLDANGQPKDTWFDVNDMPPLTPYEVVGVPNGYTFDLGQGYEVELVHLPGHTPGQSGFLDKQTGCFFIGDVTSAFGEDPVGGHPEACTINAFKAALEAVLPRMNEISGLYPGHGTFDLHPKTLKYMLDTANRILEHPDWYDDKVDFFGTPMYAKFIYQMGSDLKYTEKAVVGWKE